MERVDTRQPEWDFAKAILIIFVVWGHVCSYISDANYERNALTSVIRLYQMPMFILISGYFQKECFSFLDIKAKLVKIIQTLCIPYICWCAIGSILVIGTNAVINTEIACMGYNIIRLFAQQFSILWYLGCLILCEAVYAIVSYLSERMWGGFLLLSLSLSVILPVDIYHFSFLWPFFVLGVIFRRKNLVESFEKRPRHIVLIACAVLLCFAQFYKTEDTFYNSPNYLLSLGVLGIPQQLFFVFYRYIVYGLTTIVFLCMFFMVYKQMKDNRVADIFLNIGRNTLGMFLIHILFLYQVFRPIVEKCTDGEGLLPNHPIARYYLIGTLISVLAITLSYMLTRYINSNRLLKRILLGRTK